MHNAKAHIRNKACYKNLLLLGAMWSLFVPQFGNAANKALLIGTTSYANEEYNLSGIDLDIAEMIRVAQKLGFEEENIRTLTGSEVTMPNIESQFSGFLNRGVAPKDTVLVYYSGHGVQVPDQNGDESDGDDEAISLYDLGGRYDSENNLVWDGVLLDDHLARMLDSLVSENVIVMVDACHSGTVTRSYTGTTKAETKAYGTDVFFVKSLGAPRQATRSFGAPGDLTDYPSNGVVTLAAAQDHQKALASSKGSLFTLAVAESLETQRGSATPQSLVRAASQILDSRLDEEIAFQPNLTGDEQLFEKVIVLTDAQERGEVNQSDLLTIAQNADALPIALSQPSYYQNESIELSIDIPASGYVNILAVDSNDQIVVLFPNGLDQNNAFNKGQVLLPGGREFSWAAQPPWGVTMISVLYSEAPINLFNSSLQRDLNGQPVADYVLPSVAALNNFKKASGRKATATAFVKTCVSSNQECE